MILDTGFARSQFPAFSQSKLKGKAFFENAGGSYVCMQVIDRLSRFYTERKMQPYASHEPSRLGGEEIDEARVRLAAIMGVETDELSFGPSTTQNTYVLSQAFRQMLKPGDAVIVTDQDHEANSGPWRRLSEAEIEVREWQVNPDTGHLDVADLAQLLDAKTRLVCFPHCSNVVGEINDVKAIVKAIHEAGSVACVDGVSYAPHGIPNVEDLGADIYLFSAYKTYGPHQGIMAIRRELGMKLPNQGHHFNAACLHKRFTPAGPDHAQVAACAGIADYIDALHEHHTSTDAQPKARGTFVHDLMRAHEVTLLQPLLDHVVAKNSVRIIGPADATRRAPTLALELQGSAQEAAKALVKFGIMADGGDFYARRPLAAMGVDPTKGVLRLSFVHYTTSTEVDQLMEALDHVL